MIKSCDGPILYPIIDAIIIIFIACIGHLHSHMILSTDLSFALWILRKKFLFFFNLLSLMYYIIPYQNNCGFIVSLFGFLFLLISNRCKCF